MPTLSYVFILDDDPGRISKFKQRFVALEGELSSGRRFNVHHTDDLPTAQRWLTEEQYDIVLLDHDLTDIEEGLVLKARHRDENGYTLAHWLAMHPQIARRHGRYITHSLNDVGRDRISGALMALSIECPHAPFLWEESVFKKYINADTEEKGSPANVRYDFFKLIGTTKAEFENKSEEKQLDMIYDCVDDLCLRGQFEQVDQICEHFEPTYHSTAIGIGLMTIASAAMREGELNEGIWRAFYHRMKHSLIERKRNWKALLKGFPTGYLKHRISSYMTRLQRLKEEIDITDCRMGDDYMGDGGVLVHLSAAVTLMEEAHARISAAWVEAKREEDYDEGN